jgi:bacterioferritin
MTVPGAGGFPNACCLSFGGLAATDAKRRPGFPNRRSLVSCSENGVRSGKGSRILGMPKDTAVSRERFIELLNEDLAREYQAIIAYVIYSQTKVKTSEKAEDMLRFDLSNEQETIVNYRERIRQAEAMGEFGISEVLRKIIAQEQEHFTDLADALGIDNPTIKG